MQQMLGTTIVAVKKDGKCAVAGDGQVTFGENTIMKHTAKKVRRIYHESLWLSLSSRCYGLCRYGGGCVFTP